MQDFLRYAELDHGVSPSAMSATLGGLQASISPTVIEERQLNVAQLDVFSRLMMDRIIYLGVAINDHVANVIQAQLLYLNSVDPKRDITLFINSPGGSVTAGLGIYDTMQHVTPRVITTCTSMAASMAAVLLCAGAAGTRSILPHGRVMIHQPSGGMQGQFSDMQITYDLFRELKADLYGIMAKHSGNSLEEIERDADRDNWMRAEQALDYGFVDEILGKMV
ncbi:MAG: ATP-dependent Clp protease proteolytic subunit [Bacteroidota bacterium]